jgi:hypothetical protein
MKYVLLFCGTEEDARRYEAMSGDQLQAQLQRVGAWFADPRIRGGARLAPGTTATTVRLGAGAGGEALVTDGPFIEGKEDIGGWAIVEVADLDEALAMARAWPAGGAVEVRPLHESEQGAAEPVAR